MWFLYVLWCNVICYVLGCLDGDVVGPSITSIINRSLHNRIVPMGLKQAVIQPKLDPLELKNYCPISKLLCLSKILEKVVYSELMSFLSQYEILDQFQSGLGQFTVRPVASHRGYLITVINRVSDNCDYCALL